MRVKRNHLTDPAGDAPPTERCNKHLQKSYSDGKLVEEDETAAAAVNKKPQKAVKFLQAPTLPTTKEPSEDEVSDRDLPELAPITQQDYQRCIIAKNNSADDEPDLGKTLSPLGSTSSLQDLMECTSSARASADSTKTTWIERERQKKSVVVIEPTTGTVEAESEPALASSTEKAPAATSETWLRMDSVTTNDTTTNTVTSEDYLTAPEAAVEQLSKTDVEDDDEEEEEVEKVEHYLESPEKEKTLDKKELEEEKVVEEATNSSAAAEAAIAASEVEMREMQLKTNEEVKTEDEEKKPAEQIKSPTHSFASSSSGNSLDDLILFTRVQQLIYKVLPDQNLINPILFS